jgi:hypothetical protein
MFLGIFKANSFKKNHTILAGQGGGPGWGKCPLLPSLFAHMATINYNHNPPIVGAERNLGIYRILGGNSQNVLCKFVRFFITLRHFYGVVIHRK